MFSYMAYICYKDLINRWLLNIMLIIDSCRDMLYIILLFELLRHKP